MLVLILGRAFLISINKGAGHVKIKDTLNMGKTSFPMRAGLPKNEPIWQKSGMRTTSMSNAKIK
ncbi:isoleucyl-tRNA ligase [Lacticaseibacillus paracasei subsp. paracasei CNCM I-4270]|uniref:Isoleucyl-tRNA ligase n=1 Tax=Lacticaseibacillus paracasei subsp. paracasei CNCM I-4270 TaxID=1256202 RepID=A0A8E0MBL7_LACPA|nr:isoleucyl-tRNA ligase [Lacticaseibacillus paracasei subsp. paracasei CNCM I-4270]